MTKIQKYFHPITKLPKYRASDEEPMPTKGNQVVLEAVIEDFRDKAIAGTEKYDTLLETFNGRDAANDLYQELIDLVMYFKQLQLEWSELRGILLNYFYVMDNRFSQDLDKIYDISKLDELEVIEKRLRKMVGYKEDVS